MTTPNSEELRAVALALKDHAWLARFRKADYENKHHELSPSCANQIAGYVDDFVNKVLDSLPLDADEPISEGWLSEIGGWFSTASRVEWRFYCNTIDKSDELELLVSRWGMDEWRVSAFVGNSTMLLKIVKKKVELRDLLSALRPAK